MSPYIMHPLITDSFLTLQALKVVHSNVQKSSEWLVVPLIVQRAGINCKAIRSRSEAMIFPHTFPVSSPNPPPAETGLDIVYLSSVLDHMFASRRSQRLGHARSFGSQWCNIP